MAKESKINLNLNLIDGVTKRLDTINNSLNRFGKRFVPKAIDPINSGLTDMFKNVSQLSVGLLAVGYTASRAFDFFISGPIKAADAIGDLAQATSFSTREIQLLRRVFGDFGISADQTDNALVKFNVSLGQLRTNQGKLYQFLSKTNPALLEQLKTAKSGDEAFRSFADALFDVKDMSVRASIAAVAFGRGNSKIAGALGKTREEFQKLIADKSKIPFLEDADFAAADEADKKLQALGTQFDVLRTRLGVKLLPTINEVFQRLLSFIDRNSGKIDSLTNAFESLFKVLSTLFKPIGFILDNFIEVSSALLGIWTGIVNKIVAAANAIKSLKPFGDEPLSGQSTNQPTRGEFNKFLANNNLLPQSSSAAPAKAEVNVSFSDMPKGARVEETKNTGVDLGLLYGFRNYSMP